MKGFAVRLAPHRQLFELDGVSCCPSGLGQTPDVGRRMSAKVPEAGLALSYGGRSRLHERQDEVGDERGGIALPVKFPDLCDGATTADGTQRFKRRGVNNGGWFGPTDVDFRSAIVDRHSQRW